MAKKKAVKNDSLKIFGTLDEVLGVAVRGNPKPMKKKTAKKK
ncbi:MAG: hypothetical protein ABI763_09440 [Bacteroidota bacterium]